MRKFIILFILLTFSTVAKAFYYNNLYFYPDYKGGCELRGFDPNYNIPSTLNLHIPSYAYDSAGNAYKVTSINPGAFKGHDEIMNITIPATVEEIGYEAFMNCINIRECILT